LDADVDQVDILTQTLGWTDYDAKDISVSPEGTKILFAAIGASGSPDGHTWNIYEFDQTSGIMRRVIADPSIANQGNDTDPTYGPNGEIVFSSDRSAISNPTPGTTFEQDGQVCYELPQAANATSLHVMTAAGEGIEQLTSGLHYDVEPTLMEDGQIAFVRVFDHFEIAPQCDDAVGAVGECRNAATTPVGTVIPGVKMQIMRIDLADRRGDLLYQPVTLLGDDAKIEIEKITQAEDGVLLAMVRNTQHATALFGWSRLSIRFATAGQCHPSS
jgi:Tol biopolymer transport system component